MSETVLFSSHRYLVNFTTPFTKKHADLHSISCNYFDYSVISVIGPFLFVFGIVESQFGNLLVPNKHAVESLKKFTYNSSLAFLYVLRVNEDELFTS